jgi:hypothetical protein
LSTQARRKPLCNQRQLAHGKRFKRQPAAKSSPLNAPTLTGPAAQRSVNHATQLRGTAGERLPGIITAAIRRPELEVLRGYDTLKVAHSDD